MKLSEREWEVLRDVAKDFGTRSLPPPGTSVVYDVVYKSLSNLRLISWKQVGLSSSMTEDHYVFIGNWNRLLGVSEVKEEVQL